MNVIPALVAGVDRIVLASPPGKDGKLSAGVLAAAAELGVTEIYKMGGAQAIAALAYGTESISPSIKSRDLAIFTSPLLNGKYSARLISI